LLARTLLGHWLRWPIAAESRPTAALDADVAAYAVAREDQHVLRMPSDAQRSAWRARDTGAWAAMETRPGFQVQNRTLLGQPIPLRTAEATPQMLDLASTYDIAPEEVRSVFYNVRPSLRPLPVGVQRIGGEWFDIRGMAQIGFTDVWEQRFKIEIECMPMDGRKIAAMHPLLLFSTPHAVPTGTALADFTLHFPDGGSVQMPIVAGRDVRGYSGDDRRVPLAFAGDVGLSLMGMQDDIFAAPRIVNPEPGRAVRCLDLRTRYRQSPMLLLAATVEAPAGAAPAKSAAAGATP
jgi:hypothetical protein